MVADFQATQNHNDWNVTSVAYELPNKNLIHYGVIKWKHFPRYWPMVRGIHWWHWPFVREIYRSPVDSPHKGQCRGALMFSLIHAWTNGWANNRDAGDLRRRGAHDDAMVIVLRYINSIQFISLLSGVPDFFDRNKILSGYDLSHYQVPHCIRVFFDFVWFVFIHHNFQFYFELCTYCNILDICPSQNLNFVNHLLFYMKLLNYLFFNMFGSVLECCELTGVSLLWPWLIKWK